MFRHMGYAPKILVALAISASPVLCQDLLWYKNYGGPYNEFGNSCQQDANGDFYFLGTTYSDATNGFDIYLVKTDSLGNRLFARTYGGALSEYGYDLRMTTDGGFVIVGSTKSYGAGEKDVYLLKINADGDLQWSRTYGGVADDEGRSVRQTTDDGFIIAGGTFSFGAGYQDVYLIKTDQYGNLVWQETFGGAGGESAAAVRQTPDGGYIAVGSTGSFGDGYSSIYAVRVSQAGDSMWAATYGGLKADYGYSVETAMDGGIIIAGATASFGAGSSDAYLIKTDPSGYVEWQRTYGGADDDRAYSVKETPAGDFILAGSTLSFSSTFNVYLVKTNPVGEAIWSRNYGGVESDYCEMILRDKDNNYILVGRSYSYTSGGSDLYVLKILGDPATDVFEQLPGELPAIAELAQNYPNPFNLSTAIEFSLNSRSPVTLSIYNVLGQRVKQWSEPSLAAGIYRYEWDGQSESGNTVASGVYFYHLEAGVFSESRKMILLK
ncbi:MAG: T9SS type A sorting domain-containing protein [Candidatus Zixiibacteriota bacterium]